MATHAIPVEEKQRRILEIQQYMRDKGCTCREALAHFDITESWYYMLIRHVKQADLPTELPLPQKLEASAAPSSPPLPEEGGGQQTIPYEEQEGKQDMRKRVFRSSEEKERIVSAVRADLDAGERVGIAAAKHGISDQSFRQWEKQISRKKRRVASPSAALAPVQHQRVVTRQSGLAGLFSQLSGQQEEQQSDEDGGIEFSFKGSPAGLARFLKEIAR